MCCFQTKTDVVVADSKYSCYKHIVHKDGLSALAIDPGSKIGGNVWACRADNDIRLLRLLNHCKEPNVQFRIGDAATPFWFEPVGDAQFGPWYDCSVATKREVRKREELLIRYADAPAEWDE